jgi:hypothetical protein
VIHRIVGRRLVSRSAGLAVDASIEIEPAANGAR